VTIFETPAATGGMISTAIPASTDRVLVFRAAESVLRFSLEMLDGIRESYCGISGPHGSARKSRIARSTAFIVESPR
jgi:protoporphyrinogen oxidase